MNGVDNQFARVTGALVGGRATLQPLASLRGSYVP
jgi:hypothetical protein